MGKMEKRVEVVFERLDEKIIVLRREFKGVLR
jgi:hypothetical protein